MIGSPRIDDEIIYSWCFNSVECFDSTPSAAIIILDKDLRSFPASDPSRSHVACVLKRIKTHVVGSRSNASDAFSVDLIKAVITPQIDGSD